MARVVVDSADDKYVCWRWLLETGRNAAVSLLSNLERHL
jgi:hypothetical protein